MIRRIAKGDAAALIEQSGRGPQRYDTALDAAANALLAEWPEEAGNRLACVVDHEDTRGRPLVDEARRRAAAARSKFFGARYWRIVVVHDYFCARQFPLTDKCLCVEPTVRREVVEQPERHDHDAAWLQRMLHLSILVAMWANRLGYRPQAFGALACGIVHSGGRADLAPPAPPPDA